MKTYRIYTIFASVAVMIVSCSKLETTFGEAPSIETTRSEMQSIGYNELLALDAHVNLDDVMAYAYLKQIQKRAGSEISYFLRDVTPIGLEEDDTLAYILNYEEGWEMIAADKRAPIILGCCDEGYMYIDSLPNNIHAWVDCILSDVKSLGKAAYYEKYLTEAIYANMLSSIQFWSTIDGLKQYVKSDEGINSSTRAVIDSGHWVLVSSEYLYDYTVNVPRLTQTDFCQDSPYNNICPKKNLISSQRAVAGCVAVAGAQMLYYLHSKISCPVQAPSDGYCRTTIGASPNYAGITITNHSSAIWSSMISTPASASFLIADVGKKVHTEYGMDGSSAFTSDLQSCVFNPEGILCQYENYNADSLRASIIRGMPAIVRAADSNGNGGHSFIVDGYKQYSMRLRQTFEWQYDDYGGNYAHLQEVEDSISVTLVNTNVQSVHMNWGWGASSNSSWYTPTGNWMVGSCNFSLNRCMLWNFKLNN